MNLAVVPVKRLSEAKSRLAPGLGPSERTDLVLTLLRQTVTAIRDSGTVERILIATPEQRVAADLAADWLPDSGTLNATLVDAAGRALELGAGGLLIVPADLPFLKSDDVSNLVAAARTDPAIGIAPTQDGGTGALYLRPPDAIVPAFGEASYEKHLDLAVKRRVPVYRVTRAGFAFDVDTVEDYQAFVGNATRPE